MKNVILIILFIAVAFAIAAATVDHNAKPQDGYPYAWKAIMGGENPTERQEYNKWRDEGGHN